MDNEAHILLDDTISFCRRDGQDRRLINLLEQSEALALDDDSLTVAVPSRFAYSYLVKQRELIERYLEEITFGPMSLDVTVTDQGVAGNSRMMMPDAPKAAAATDTTEEVDEHPVVWPQPHRATDTSSQGDQTSTGITVKNTVSADEYLRLKAAMRGETAAPRPSSRHLEPRTDAPIDEDNRLGPDVNSKFTFESFVFGDENKHAYQSSLSFAALADAPGKCTSLFIYGKSGLGKTHLLLAIKNYIAGEKPWIRVKYANSQAYLDDYMQDLASAQQKGTGARIMREYRDADVLIIDDIQNIVGKQASVEFFFQLVDEFIRSGKKIAIASDRAPKNLGLDERLTSRFNAGMLCLVSEPGFEMKYAILTRYYETTIKGTGSMDFPGLEPSLLNGLQLEGGRLTDDQLKHMAEISGNNIRELEGFCERCAGLSFEKEQAGEELTGQDIDRIADEFFDTAHKVVQPGTIQRVVEEYYHVSHEDLISRKRTKNIAFPRHVAIYLTNTMCEMSLKAVGAEFGRDHTTVIHSIEVVEKLTAEDDRFKKELQQLKNIVLLKS